MGRIMSRLKSLVLRCLPKLILDKIEPEGLMKFVKFASSKCADNTIVLDAYAGEAHYKKSFTHVRYIAMDWDKTGSHSAKLDIIGDLLAIPLKDRCIDAVFSTFVLEHTPKPKQMLESLYRILKPQGQLFIVVPLGIGLHMRPFDYFRFTSYGLEYLLSEAGFRVLSIEPLSGYFSFIAENLKPCGRNATNKLSKPFLLFLFSIIVPYICFYLDKYIDRSGKYSTGYKTNTIGYAGYCYKPNGKKLLFDG